MNILLTYVLLLNNLIALYFTMNTDIPAYFEDIEPFHEIEFDKLIQLTNEEKRNNSLLLENYRVPEPEKFTFLAYSISFFALGIDQSEKVKSAVLIIDDGENGEKMFKDLVTYNGEPDLVVDIKADAETKDQGLMKDLQLKSYIWHMGRSSMSFSAYPAAKGEHSNLRARIHLKIIK